MRWGWMARSAWEATKPLPGTLADEAPDGNERIPAELAAQIRPRGLGEMPMVAPPRAEAGRWQPRYDDDPAPQPAAERVTADLHAIDDRRTLEDRYLAVCQQLREVTADRDRLEHVNDGLRTALAELGRRLDAAGPLRVADDGLLIGPYGTEAGR